MARFARVVVPGIPHHVTQRGNDRQDVFFCDDDRRMYLTILRDHCRRQGVSVLAWCLMTNHVHFVVLPEHENSLAAAFGRTHNEYARWLHVRQRGIGHLWQNRFHSCPLEGRHLWDAVLYVEMNPVRAGMAQEATHWRWSSAAAHVTAEDPWRLTDLGWWHANAEPGWWPRVLASGFQQAQVQMRIREATQTGRPLGSDEFVKQIECAVARPLLPRKRGPKPRAGAESRQLNLVIS
jgi:putative transposase